MKKKVRPAYVNFAVPQQELARMTKGTAIEVVSDALGKSEFGKIAALEQYMQLKD